MNIAIPIKTRQAPRHHFQLLARVRSFDSLEACPTLTSHETDHRNS